MSHAESTQLPADAQAVLDYWFGAPRSPEWNTVRPLWFTKSDATDDDIRSRFQSTWAAARAGACDVWCETPLGSCAFIILTDQLSRNMFRGRPESFATDAQALDVARKMVADGADLKLPTHFHRQFCYMPFEHDESLDSQDEAIRLFSELRDDTGMGDALHWDIIVRFGRYPHRNAILGRPSTSEEIAFLAQPGSSF
jgi:uncharacterized protein (DUF924 family)